MKKCYWIALAALTAVLLGQPGSQAGDDDKAKELFDKMEKKITEAKTLTVESDAKTEFGGMEGSMKGKLVLAAGNKMHLEATMTFGDKDVTLKSISDGTKSVTTDPKGELKEKDTDKNLHENVSVIVARMGAKGEGF